MGLDKIKIKFRFQDFEIWKDSVDLTRVLLNISSQLEVRKQFSFADQLRRATLSISNNIAEGSGSDSMKDFSHFLTISKRSVFECANMILIMDELFPGNEVDKDEILNKLDHLSRKITNFKKTLCA